VKLGSALILLGAIGLNVLLVLGGLGAITFGVAGVLFFGSGALLPIALIGIVALGAGIGFAFKVTRPAWRLAKED
jgi:hypothetical protein